MLFINICALFCVAAPALARIVPFHVPAPLERRQDPTTTGDAPTPHSTACGDIIAAVDSPDEYNLFWAKDAHDCLASVPFNAAVASRFLKYWNETVQFQSTLAYLKNPPEGYQQPAVDVAERVAAIQNGIDSGVYTNQYSFELDFQLLIAEIHDKHVDYVGGAMRAFTWGSPYEIVSLSIDGKEAPKVYITESLVEANETGIYPAAITTINGEDVVSFLTKFAALNSRGYIEPHAEWNALMSSPALSIQGGATAFSGGARFYPGDNLTFAFEDGSNITTVWFALYSGLANRTGPLTTGGDFYNYFVLGELPASFDPSLIEPLSFFRPDTEELQTSLFEESYGAYPENPDIIQYGVGALSPGFVTGYFLEDISTGVLSLPSFDVITDSIGNYTDSILDFCGNASAANMSRVVIDLQQNSGGNTLLAYTTFKAFFPDLIPFGGSRRRSFDMANAIGELTTGLWTLLDDTDPTEHLYKAYTASYEWVVASRINAATGNNFTSWAEYQGPLQDNGDFFTLTERYDLANPVFDQAAFDQWVPTAYLGDQSRFTREDRKWEAEEIVILTDGLCSSTCALLVEMMTRVGVRTVVAGGRPSTGPMQAVGGNRGAHISSAAQLDLEISNAQIINSLFDADLNGTLPDVRDPAMYTIAAGINLRDQIRENDTMPLQFKYEAADCRIYYTFNNIYNMTQLWHDAATATFFDNSLCVEGSTGYSTTNNTNPMPAPKPEAKPPVAISTINSTTTEQANGHDDPNQGLRDAKTGSTSRPTFAPCIKGRCTDRSLICIPKLTVPCLGERGESAPILNDVCVPMCNNVGGPCTGGVCDLQRRHLSKTQIARVPPRLRVNYGLCIPETGTTGLGCPYDAPPEFDPSRYSRSGLK